MPTNNSINSTSPIQIQMGGTGINTASSYSVICAGITATNPFQTVPSGISNQVIVSQGTGSLPSYSNLNLSPAFIQTVMQTFTSSGTYTPTNGMRYCKITCVGGGGAGGGAAATGGATQSAGAGGGAGEYAEGIFSAATIGSSQIIGIGAGGTGNSGAAGNNGGNTSVGAIISANGGSGGATGAAGTNSGAVGALGGTGGSGGDFRTPGRSGYEGVACANFFWSGQGGSSQFGAGGVGKADISGAGTNALGYGSGGSGGANYISQLANAGGNGTSGIVIVQEFITSVPTPFQISFGGDTQGYTFFLKGDGSAWSSGNNQYGQSGNLTANVSYSSPIVAIGNHSFSSIAGGGYNFNLALKSNGSAWSLGSAIDGELGNGDSVHDVSSPVSVIGNHSFVKIACGSLAGYGLKNDGSCWAWGNNDNGELGDQTNVSKSSPINIVGGISFIQVLGSRKWASALNVNGNFFFWGFNQLGQAGNQTSGTTYSSPVIAVGNHSFVKIACGGMSSYGLKNDGSCWAWGANGVGELGDQTNTNKSSAILVIGNHSFIDIAAINSANGTLSTAFGLKSDGSIWGWGANSFGELGDGTVTSKSSPTLIIGNHSFIRMMISSASQNMGAIKSDKTIWTWGRNTSGQLGDGTVTNKSSPVLVLNTP